MFNKKIENINCKVFYPENEIKQVLIAVHGFAGDCESSVISAVASLLGDNTLTLAFDLPCHGGDKTTGTLRLENCFEYLDKVTSYVKQKYKDVPISFFATSFGAYLLLNHLNHDKYNYLHIILRSPAIFMDEVLENNILPCHDLTIDDLMQNPQNLGFEKELIIDIAFLQELKSNSLKDAKFGIHIDVIQGDQDDVVSIVDNDKFFKSNCSDYNIYYIKGADHRFKKPGELEQILKIVKDIMK